MTSSVRLSISLESQCPYKAPQTVCGLSLSKAALNIQNTQKNTPNTSKNTENIQSSQKNGAKNAEKSSENPNVEKEFIEKLLYSEDDNDYQLDCFFKHVISEYNLDVSTCLMGRFDMMLSLFPNLEGKHLPGYSGPEIMDQSDVSFLVANGV